MYLTRLHVKNVKLLRSLTLDFTHENRPRPWTVFVAESGACKTTLLQTIALAASGGERASLLADVASMPDMRRPTDAPRISADFEFGTRLAQWRRFPEPHLFVKSRDPLRLRSTLGLPPGQTRFSGDSWFAPRDVLASVPDEAPQLNAVALLESFQERSRTGAASASRFQMGRLSNAESTHFWQMLSYAFTRGDQISEARGRSMPGWLVAGYGTQRQLLPPAQQPLIYSERVFSRLEPLFGRVSPMGTALTQVLADRGWIDPYVQALRQVLVEHQLLPHVQDIQWETEEEPRSDRAPEPPRLTFSLANQKTRVPAHWLSQAYQSTLSWVADFIGQMYLDLGRSIPMEDMEGVVLLDEPELHLPFPWQGRLVPVLRRLFPRTQFIVTTHSPMLLPAFERHELVRLRLNDQGDVEAEPCPSLPRPLTAEGKTDATGAQPGTEPLI